MRITAHVTPRAHANEVVSKGVEGWKIRVTSSPTDGEANEAVCRIVAEELNVAPSRVKIFHGHTSKTKIIEVS